MILNQPKYTSVLIQIGILGLFIYALGLFGLISPLVLFPASLLLIFKTYRSINIKKKLGCLKNLHPIEGFLLGIILLQCLLYSLAAFVPETGFDALWYHLPLSQVYAATGTIARIPELLYSTMPRLGEMYFTLALTLFSTVTAAKLVSFTFFLIFTLLSYRIARRFLSRPAALLATATSSSPLVVAWQAGSAYVDLTSAVFQLGSLLALLTFLEAKPSKDKQLTLLISAGILAGFALSTKFVAVVHLTAAATLILTQPLSIKRRFLHLLYFLLPALFTASPWYLYNYLATGHPLYPTNLAAKQLDQLQHSGGFTTLSSWFVHQLRRLPALLYHLTYTGSGFLTPAILILFPLLIFRLKHLFSSQIAPLIVYTPTYLVLWWFIPPPETRYMLAALPSLIVVGVYSFTTLPQKFRSLQYIVTLALLVSIGINFAARAYASRKYIRYIFGSQTKAEYLNSQSTPFIKELIHKFHSGYWKNYQYPSTPSQ